MTTAARVACGISPMNGASSSIVTSVAAAVTSAASCVRAPASRFTAVCEVPPPAGIAPRNAPPAFARPVASSSRFACGARLAALGERAPGRDRLGEAHQRDAQRRRPESLRSARGPAGRGTADPVGTWPTVCHAVGPAGRADSWRRSRRRPRSAAPARAGSGARSPPGWRSSRRRPPPSPATSRECPVTMARRLWRNDPLAKVDAQQLRNLIQHDDESDPRLESDQHRLGDEVGDEAEPQDRRQPRAWRRRATSASRDAVSSDAGSPPGATSPRAAAARMASVVVVLTLSGREVPSTA